MKGVVAAMLIAGSLSAHNKSTESLESLFEGKPSRGSAASLYRFIDLNMLFEEFPEAGKDFKKLSQEDKDKIIESVDLFNEAFSEAFGEILASLDEEEPPV